MKTFGLMFLAFVSLALPGCAGDGGTSPGEAGFRFTVAEAYYHDAFRGAPEPNVVAAGTVEEGAVRVGDEVVVRYRGGEDAVRVLAILGADRAMDSASKGEGAGLRLKVASKDQYRRWSAGDEAGVQIVGQFRK